MLNTFPLGLVLTQTDDDPIKALTVVYISNFVFKVRHESNLNMQNQCVGQCGLAATEPEDIRGQCTSVITNTNNCQEDINS